MELKCDICNNVIQGKLIFSVDMCTIPKRGGLNIEQTVDVCPECLKEQSEKIYSEFLEPSNSGIKTELEMGFSSDTDTKDPLKEIDEKIMTEVIKSVVEGNEVNQKLTICSSFAVKLLVAVEETEPMAEKCPVAGWLLENVFPITCYKGVWNFVVKYVPETNGYDSSYMSQLIQRVKLGQDMESLLIEIEQRIKNEQISPCITVRSPRLVAALNYVEKTTPGFKKELAAAQLLENEVIVHLGDPDNLEILF